MTGLYFLDDARARGFEPFALTRPACELVVGMAAVRQRWEAALRLPGAGLLVPPHLRDYEEAGAPRAATGELAAGSVVVNSRCAPRLLALPEGALGAVGAAAAADAGPPAPRATVWRCGGRVASVRLAAPVDAARAGESELEALAALAGSDAEEAELEGWWLDEVWDIVKLLPEVLGDDLSRLASGALGALPVGYGAPPAHVSVIGEHAVLVAGDSVAAGAAARAAVIEPHVVFDTSAGPVVVAHGAAIRAFSRVAGPCWIGPDSTIVGGDINGCSIGPVCKVRGEMTSCVMFGYSNKGHEGFVGHSVLGRWVNLGAGTTTSNLKNTYGSVALWTPEGIRSTGLQFLGTLFGDHAKTGIGMTLTTGTVLGAGAQVYGSVMPPKAVPPFAWGERVPYDSYRADKFIEVATRVMQRRHVTLGEQGRAQLLAAHARAAEASYATRWAMEPERGG